MLCLVVAAVLPDFLLVPAHCRPGGLVERPEPGFATRPSGMMRNLLQFSIASPSLALGEEHPGV